MEFIIHNPHTTLTFKDVKMGGAFINGSNLYVKCASHHARCVNIPSPEAVMFALTAPIMEVATLRVVLK